MSVVTREDFYEIKKELKPLTPVKILTGSMTPFIRPGQTVLINPFVPAQLRRFDSLVYWREDKLICHFFYGTVEKGGRTEFYTKGLNSKSLDAPVLEEDVLGVVVKPKLPGWKRFFMRFLF